jgi:hypothetical protein
MAGPQELEPGPRSSLEHSHFKQEVCYDVEIHRRASVNYLIFGSLSEFGVGIKGAAAMLPCLVSCGIAGGKDSNLNGAAPRPMLQCARDHE